MEGSTMEKYYGVIETSHTGSCDAKHEMFDTLEEAYKRANEIAEKDHQGIKGSKEVRMHGLKLTNLQIKTLRNILIV